MQSGVQIEARLRHHRAAIGERVDLGIDVVGWFAHREQRHPRERHGPKRIAEGHGVDIDDPGQHPVVNDDVLGGDVVEKRPRANVNKVSIMRDSFASTRSAQSGATTLERSIQPRPRRSDALSTSVHSGSSTESYASA